MAMQMTKPEAANVEYAVKACATNSPDAFNALAQVNKDIRQQLVSSVDKLTSPIYSANKTPNVEKGPTTPRFGK